MKKEIKIEKYILSKKGSCLDFPFGPEAAVYKVGSKMFALGSWQEKVPWLNLKCDPEDADILRSMFDSIKPAYHMNKRHWNSVYLDGTVPEEILYQMIDDSYNLVVKGLSRAERKRVTMAAILKPRAGKPMFHPRRLALRAERSSL